MGVANGVYTQRQGMEIRMDHPFMIALLNYIQKGAHPGGFLSHIVSNQLNEALFSASNDENLALIPAISGYLFNEAPRDCWGSRNKFLNWKGLEYLEEQERIRQAKIDEHKRNQEEFLYTVRLNQESILRNFGGNP